MQQQRTGTTHSIVPRRRRQISADRPAPLARYKMLWPARNAAACPHLTSPARRRSARMYYLHAPVSCSISALACLLSVVSVSMARSLRSSSPYTINTTHRARLAGQSKLPPQQDTLKMASSSYHVILIMPNTMLRHETTKKVSRNEAHQTISSTHAQPLAICIETGTSSAPPHIP